MRESNGIRKGTMRFLNMDPYRLMVFESRIENVYCMFEAIMLIIAACCIVSLILGTAVGCSMLEICATPLRIRCDLITSMNTALSRGVSSVRDSLDEHLRRWSTRFVFCRCRKSKEINLLCWFDDLVISIGVPSGYAYQRDGKDTYTILIFADVSNMTQGHRRHRAARVIQNHLRRCIVRRRFELVKICIRYDLPIASVLSCYMQPIPIRESHESNSGLADIVPIHSSQF